MEMVQIKNEIEKIQNWNPKKDLFIDEFDYIDLSSVDKNIKEINDELVGRILVANAPSRAKQRVKINDILVATVRPNLNGVALVSKEYKFATASTGYCVLRPKKSLDSKYLFYWVQTPFFIKDMSNKASGASYPAVSDRIIKESKIPLPPLAEQKCIANILDHADQLRQLNQQILAEYDVLTKSLFLDMFGDPVANPMGWEEVLFTDILILRRGFDLPKQNRVKGIYPIMASNGILDWHNEYKVNGPGIVTGRSGTLGKVHYVKSDYWPLNTALYSLDLKGNNPTYLLYLIKNFRIDRFARGAGVPTLNRNLVHAEKIIKVPTQLQNQFAQKIKNIEAQKAKAQAALAASEDLFNHLLQKAFKGEL